MGFGAMDATKPYKFIGFGAIDATKPYTFIGFGAIDVTVSHVLEIRSVSTSFHEGVDHTTPDIHTRWLR